MSHLVMEFRGINRTNHLEIKEGGFYLEKNPFKHFHRQHKISRDEPRTNLPQNIWRHKSTIFSYNL